MFADKLWFESAVFALRFVVYLLLPNLTLLGILIQEIDVHRYVLVSICFDRLILDVSRESTMCRVSLLSLEVLLVTCTLGS